MSSKSEIIANAILEGVTIEEFVDAVVQINGFVGVGLVTLGENLQKATIDSAKRPKPFTDAQVHAIRSEFLRRKG